LTDTKSADIFALRRCHDVCKLPLTDNSVKDLSQQQSHRNCHALLLAYLYILLTDHQPLSSSSSSRSSLCANCANKKSYEVRSRLLSSHCSTCHYLTPVLQERQTCALEAFDTGLAKRYTPIATVSGTQQDQVLQARSQLAAELSAHSGAVLQQVEAAAAAAAARAQSLAPQQCRDQERVAEAALQAFQVQLQLVEDTCTVVDEARQSCKVGRVCGTPWANSSLMNS